MDAKIDLTLMEYDTKMGIWMPVLGLKDYPIVPHAGDHMTIPMKGEPLEDGAILRVVRVVRRELPTPTIGKTMSLYIEEVA